MAQHDYVIDNSTGQNVRADINSVLQAIATNNSGSSDPGTTFASQFFADTNAGIMKLRNTSNNGYVNLFTLAGGIDVDSASIFNEDVTLTGASANIVFDKSDNALEFADNAKAIFGTGGDLEVFHDTNDSIINDSGTGNLKLQTGGNTKVEVTSTGASVTGNIVVSGTVDGRDVASDGSKLDNLVSVKDFGALGDGSTNDATAFTNALAAEKAIYVPAGTYVIGSTLTISDKNVTLIGEGERLSILKFTGGTDGLNWTSTDDSHSLILEKLQFQASATMSGSPVDANFDVTIGSIRAGVTLENIVAAGTGSGAWTEGFRFNNCRNSAMYECIFNGVTATSTYGYKFTGQCLDFLADRCQANDINAGSGQAFIVEGTCEGIQIKSCFAINTKIGVDHATTNMEPYLSVIGSHFNSRQFGVRISKAEQCIISNNLFYADTENPSAVEDYVGVNLNANSDNDFNSITDNIFHASRTNNGSAVTEIGVRVQHGDSNIIANNVFKVFDTGILIEDAATNTQLSDNRYGNVTTKEDIGNTTAISFFANDNRYEVSGNGNKDIQLQLNSGTDGFKLSCFSDGTSGVESTNSADIRFITNGQRMQISSNGNIGAPNGSNIFNASDSRVKKNVVTLDKGLSDLVYKVISFNL